MKALRIFLPTVFFVSLLCIPLFARENPPLAVVKKWIRVYGVDQDRASELTTLRFREGKVKKTWADETRRILKKIGYKHLGGEFLGEEIKGIEARVVLRTTIETIAGRSKQKEVYLLFLVNDKWLIDNIVIGEEEIRERGIVL